MKWRKRETMRKHCSKTFSVVCVSLCHVSCCYGFGQEDLLMRTTTAHGSSLFSDASLLSFSSIGIFWPELIPLTMWRNFFFDSKKDEYKKRIERGLTLFYVILNVRHYSHVDVCFFLNRRINGLFSISCIQASAIVTHKLSISTAQ